MSPTDPLVGIVILNWNGLTDTLECLKSLRHSTYQSVHIYVLDNGSRDDPTEALDAFPEVTLIRSSRNLGFAGGSNLGARQALADGCDLLLFLNNDTLVPPDTLACLVEAQQHTPQAGLLAARERGAHPHPRGDRAGGHWQRLRCKVKWEWVPSNERQKGLKEFDVLSGCALLMPRALTDEVGLFDEAFFAYGEDVDLSLRVLQAGYRNYCVMHTHVVHKSGQSTRTGHGPNLIQLYLVCRGQTLLLRKQARGVKLLPSALRLMVSGTIAWGHGLLSHQYRPSAEAKVTGFLDGWHCRPPDPRWVKP